ncbi:GntP family permease [Halioxenophilus sp. WMMB6]|uniref:GntP family permease n=1 Tax=Halioxenophilus sp. WMMB6 TaxID=3073815 RepID=UPI00295EDF4B|nr:GntP family permease [Halioxenophilus sp. WMMB6]
MLSLFGLVAGLVLLVVFAIRGMHLLIAAPLAALLIAVTGGLPLFAQLAAEGQANYVGTFMDGFTGFFKDWFFMFLLGAIFGKAMENSHAAESIANWVIGRIGMQHAALALLTACAILTYGGVSVFIVAFCVYSMALSLWRRADLPRRFIPAVIAFGSVTFTMTSAGSPEIQNWIPIRYLGTTPYAGWPVSIAAALFMAVAGYFWMRRMITTAVARGERFEEREGDVAEIERTTLPNPFLCLLPLVAVLGVSFFCHQLFGTAALIVALFSGLLLTYLLNYRFFRSLSQPFAEGATGALIATANTCAVVGFGTVAKATPAFAGVVAFITDIPGGGLIGAAIAVTVICALTGSASGGQSIALPLLAPIYTGADVTADHRVDPEALHRVVSIASGGLDSLPHNGYVVTLIRAICGESHKDAYLPLAKLTVVVPFAGLVLALIAFTIF